MELVNRVKSAIRRASNGPRSYFNETLLKPAQQNGIKGLISGLNKFGRDIQGVSAPVKNIASNVGQLNLHPKVNEYANRVEKLADQVGNHGRQLERIK